MSPKKKDNKLQVINTSTLDPSVAALPATLSPIARTPRSKRLSKAVLEINDEKQEDQESDNLIPNQSEQVDDTENDSHYPSLHKIFQFIIGFISILFSNPDHCFGDLCYVLISCHYLTVGLSFIQIIVSMVERWNTKYYKSVENYINRTMSLIWFITNVSELVFPGGTLTVTDDRFLVVVVCGWLIGFVGFIEVWAEIFQSYFNHLAQIYQEEGQGVVTLFTTVERFFSNFKNVLRAGQAAFSPLILLSFIEGTTFVKYFYMIIGSVILIQLINSFFHPRLYKASRVVTEVVLDFFVIVFTAILIVIALVESTVDPKIMIAEVAVLFMAVFSLIGAAFECYEIFVFDVTTGQNKF